MSKILTFRGGIHPGCRKDMSLGEALREVPLPKVAVVPLSQHIGAPNLPLVKKGDTVAEGDVIGRSESFVSAAVHSPVSGKVADIKKAPHPSLGQAMSVFIERDDLSGKKEYSVKNDIERLSPADIIEKIKLAGVVGMGGAAFPTHVKLSVPAGKNIDTLIVNGAECEPYLTCDQALMSLKTKEIIAGIALVQKVLRPVRTFIALEDNKKEAAFAFEKAVKAQSRILSGEVSVVLLKTKYPQGGEKQLIKAITSREVPPGKLPLDIGCMVQNAGTMNAVYEAAAMDKPLIERLVTVSGDCVAKPGNYLARVGTTVEELVSMCAIEIKTEPFKVIFGGPMMGVSQTGMLSPVLKNTSGILFLSRKAAGHHTEQNCIRCAKCVDVCPMRLAPTDIMRNVKKENWAALSEFYVSDCMECGACAYICPSRIPLVHYIKEGKAVIARMKRP